MNNFKILTTKYLDIYKKRIDFSIETQLNNLEKTVELVDYFDFYNSISSVYSSKIEGENVDFDSFYRHKFMNIRYLKSYTQRADDLFLAYVFILENNISAKNIIKAHKILSKHLLPKEQQGFIRKNPMFIVNNNDKIEYVAANSDILKEELNKLIHDIKLLITKKLDLIEIFYFASLIHLVFVKIHPFNDGNGRTSRLLEKWFLIQKLGNESVNIKSEKYYYNNLNDYYLNLKKLGVEYEELNYDNCIDFLLMLPNSLK